MKKLSELTAEDINQIQLRSEGLQVLVPYNGTSLLYNPNKSMGENPEYIEGFIPKILILKEVKSILND